jgi:pyruvate ferredoxin oxidoreductase gamma subunit
VFQVRIHGRGGQGVVAAAEILSMASFDEGRYAQAFPSFGSERMGAPVVSYCRIDDRPIRTHEPIVEPDALLVQDATLVHQVDLFRGLTGEAYVLVNTSKSFEELGLADFAAGFRPDRLLTCPATALALEHVGRPLPNAALLGGFAALTHRISLDALERAVGERFVGPVGAANAAAARAAYAHVEDEARSERARGVTARARAD